MREVPTFASHHLKFHFLCLQQLKTDVLLHTLNMSCGFWHKHKVSSLILFFIEIFCIYVLSVVEAQWGHLKVAICISERATTSTAASTSSPHYHHCCSGTKKSRPHSQSRLQSSDWLRSLVRLLSVSTATDVSESVKKSKMWEAIQKSGSSLRLFLHTKLKLLLNLNLIVFRFGCIDWKILNHPNYAADQHLQQ